jgi:hypothetical protein
VAIVESLWRGEHASIYCNWNLVPLNTKTSSLERLIPILIGHVLAAIGQYNMFLILLPPTQHVSYIVGEVIVLFHTLVCRSMDAILSSFDFDIAQSPYVGLLCPTYFT